MQRVRAKTHALQRAGTIVLDQHMRGVGELQQQLARLRVAQVQRQALLVARVGLPEERLAADLPVAQRIALARVLDLDHLGAEVGQLQRQHVARDEARQVEHDDAFKRAGGVGLERGDGRFWFHCRRV